LADEYIREKSKLVMPVGIQPGQSHQVAFACSLQFLDGRDLPSLLVQDPTGGVWYAHGLDRGGYNVRLLYANKVPTAGEVAGSDARMASGVPADAPLWVAEAGTNKILIKIQ